MYATTVLEKFFGQKVVVGEVLRQVCMSNSVVGKKGAKRGISLFAS